MWAKLAKHWFLIALASCFAVGYLAAEQVQPVLQMTRLRGGLVFVVMWAMGVTLRGETVRQSMTKPLPSLLAIAVNMVWVPLLCLPAFWAFPDRFSGGLFVTAIVPCTLASASVWTRKADGDDSIAMMTTVVTNLACVIVVPLGIWFALSQQTEIDAAQQVRKLALVVVLPLILAQLMRRGGASGWADRNKIRLSLLGQCGILTMVVFGAAASASVVGQAGQEPSEALSWRMISALIVAAAVVHTLALSSGVAVARLLRLAPASQIAVGIAGSQKTLMVGLQIALDTGVSVIPMLVYHLCQLVIDTVIADHWKQRYGRSSSTNVSSA